MSELTHARLLECLSYEPETGDLLWRLGGAGRRKIGAVAGNIENGYRRISIDDKSYMAHRLVWFYAHGVWPREVDHKDGNRANNRLDNLREATRSQNNANMRRPRDNTSGFKGVAWHPNGYYTAQIIVNKVKHYLGHFDDPAKGHAAYVEAAKRLNGEFARGE